MTLGSVCDGTVLLTRLHSEWLTRDVLGSVRCDCGEQVGRSLQMIGRVGCGVLLCLRQDGRGIWPRDTLRACNLQDEGLDCVEANFGLGWGADVREHGVAARILDDLGAQSVNLLMNHLLDLGGGLRLSGDKP